MERNASLILGIGNPALTDDGVGPRVVEDLAQKLPLPNVDYETAFLGGLDILGLIEGYEVVIFVDAMRSRGGVPGSVSQFTLADFQETLHLSNFHDISFLAAIEMGKMLDLNMPKSISIVGIEIVEDLVFSIDFSYPLKTRYEEIVQETGDLVRVAVNEFTKSNVVLGGDVTSNQFAEGVCHE